MNPFYEEIKFTSPEQIFALFHNNYGSIWLDSANSNQETTDRNTYSYIAIDPFMILSSVEGKLVANQQKILGSPFQFLKKKLAEFQLCSVNEIPPLQGGVCGYFSYDLCHQLEPVDLPFSDEMHFPEMILGFYDLIISFDHSQQRAWIVSTGFPETTPTARINRAKQRLQWLKSQVSQELVKQPHIKKVQVDHVISNFTQQTYEQTIKKVINYIVEGDIFEANLSQRFSANLPDNANPFDLYLQLRKINAAPFAAYVNFDKYIIASASPERFLKLDINGKVETRPIKGTRIRYEDSLLDKKSAQELLDSPKDRAENVMIVDLMRNDLSRVCQDDSIQVSQLCSLESFNTVHHLVSVIGGQLREGYDATDLLTATFPGGSVTGAPKVRAMQIISELEPHRRGPYCGNLGYISFNGAMDTSIIIRSYVIQKKFLTFHAGGAVVLDSDPTSEYQETLNKAAALLEALKSF